jgi:3-methyladenine DNA glycosylase AlkD
MKAIKAASAKPQNAEISAADAIKHLLMLGNATVAQHVRGFFKTGPGEYGEGDQFLGIRQPVLRHFVRDFRDAGIEMALPLLKSSWHEARSLSLMLLVKAYHRAVLRGDENTQKQIYDLVDLSAEHIVGAWLHSRDRSPLTKLAKSRSLWERRIAILATFHYIKKGEYAETLRIAKFLLKDDEDLIQKAVGWMLREVGKRVGEEVEETFLKRHYRAMPRTMLRYAIERFAETKRRQYLRGEI